MIERRRAPRIPARWEVTVVDGAGRRLEGTAVDVSPLGMQMQLSGSLRPHRFLLLSFTPSDGKGPLWVDFDIVRQQSEFVYGIRFLNLAPSIAQRLSQFKAVE